MTHSICMDRHLKIATNHHILNISQNKTRQSRQRNHIIISFFLLILILNQSYHQKHLLHTYIANIYHS